MAVAVAKKKKEILYPESIADFEEAFGKFRLVESGFRPSQIDKWFNSVQTAHQDVRALIDGIRISKTIDLPAFFDEDSFGYAVQYYLDNMILYIMPGYLKEYNLEKKDLLKDKIGKIKTSKHILTYARKMNLPLNQINTIEYYLSIIGDTKRRYTVKAQKMTVTLSTSADAFVKLGHYGPDNDSCFGQCGQNDSHKYNLATAKNSFVILFSDKEINCSEFEIDDIKIHGRMWGYFNKNLDRINLTNLYYDSHSDQTFCQLIELFTKELFKCDQVYVLKDDQSLVDVSPNLYLNDDPHWTISSKKIETSAQDYLSVTQTTGW